MRSGSFWAASIQESTALKHSASRLVPLGSATQVSWECRTVSLRIPSALPGSMVRTLILLLGASGWCTLAVLPIVAAGPDEPARADRTLGGEPDRTVGDIVVREEASPVNGGVCGLNLLLGRCASGALMSDQTPSLSGRNPGLITVVGNGFGVVNAHQTPPPTLGRNAATRARSGRTGGPSRRASPPGNAVGVRARRCRELLRAYRKRLWRAMVPPSNTPI